MYSEHLIPQLKTGGGGALQFRIGALRVYAALLSGSNTAKTVTADHMQMISEALLDRDLMTSESIALLLELAKLVSVLMASPPGLLKIDDKASYNYFLVLSFLLSTEGEINVPFYPELKSAVSLFWSSLRCSRSSIDKQTRKALDDLTSQLSLPSTQAVFALYFDQTLLLVSDSIPTWTRYSPERHLLNTLLLESGPFVGQKLELILPVFRALSAPDVEFEIKEGYTYSLKASHPC